MNWISNLRRPSAIKKYARKLGPLLARRYGKSNTYTAGQIKKTAEHARLPLAYICYGYAMYIGEDDFDILHRELGQSCDYEATSPLTKSGVSDSV